jgi:FkbM family methyltransferase
MELLKQAIKSILGRLGYVIERKIPACHFPPGILSFIVSERLRSTRPFFFVQVGANDGIVADPLRPLILKFGLRGLLIEPQSDQFAELIKNYSGSPQLLFENCAVGDRDGECVMYRIRDSAPHSGPVSCLTSFSKAAVLSQPNVRTEHIEEFVVSLKTFRSLMTTFKIDDVSLLQVDAEGLDFEIVKLAFAAGIRPDIINFEFALLPYHERVECHNVLRINGYQFLEIGMDMIAVRRDWAVGELGFVSHS